MAEYVSEHRDRRAGGYTSHAPERGRHGDAPVDGDHLLMMHLLYVRTTQKGGQAGARVRNGYTSLDSLRQVSGLPAWRVWELIDGLQELDLVSCIWDSRVPRTPAPEQNADGRFLHCTQVGLTAEGRSYPPLHDYHRLQDPSRREPGEGQRRPETGREPEREPRQERRPPQGYRVYRPQVRAARRLAVLACVFAVLVLTAAVAAILAFL